MQTSPMTTRAEMPRRTIRFAGLRWWVKCEDERVGPGPNWFDDSPRTVQVNPDGSLVLRVRRDGSRWVCAEVVGEEPIGYGRYEWTVRSDVSGLDRHVVLGMFTWSDEPCQFNREIDIEVSAWRSDDGVIGQFVVQPSDEPGHLRPFTIPQTAPWRCAFDWSPGRVTFSAAGGQRWTFDSQGVPTAEHTHPRINLWLDGGVEPAGATAITVTLDDFTFTPHRPTS
jgi:hypothetical protein